MQDVILGYLEREKEALDGEDHWQQVLHVSAMIRTFSSNRI